MSHNKRHTDPPASTSAIAVFIAIPAVASGPFLASALAISASVAGPPNSLAAAINK